MISERSASTIRQASGWLAVAAESGQPFPRMNRFPSLSSTVASPPKTFDLLFYSRLLVLTAEFGGQRSIPIIAIYWFGVSEWCGQTRAV